MTLDSAYKLLGASKEDSDMEVKKKYHSLVMQYHPDKHSDDIEFATRKTQEINLAYEIIIDSRSGKSKDFDWGLKVKVTYNRPPRPKGRTNPNANIARSTFGYHCDFWNLWKPKEEDEFSFLHSLYRDIYRKIQQIKSNCDLLFFAPIIDRITYFGAAEYVDPYSSLCELYDTTDISNVVFLTVEASQDVNMQINSPVNIIYDQSVLGQPYTISFQMLDGTIIGSVRSMRSVCISLLKHYANATISGTISSISNGMKYDCTTRKHITVKCIKVKLHITFDKNNNSWFGFVNNHAQIKELFDLYSVCARYTENYFKERLFETEDTQNLYQNIFSKVLKPEIKCSPIYTLDYRVFEGDAVEIQGEARCVNFTKLNFLDKNEKDLLCYAFGVSRKYGTLKKVCNSTIKYYRYDGKKAFFLIRLYTQKNPNGEDSVVQHWHNVRIQIYPNES